MLKEFFPYETAREIATLSTVRTPGEGESYHLPYGFPQSTIIASICLRKSALGAYLHTLSDLLSVSVYVDDIIVSGINYQFLTGACEKLVERSDRSRLPFGDNTTKVLDQTTAFNIELQHQSLTITPEKYSALALKALSTDNEHVQSGILSYINSINRTQHQKLVSDLVTHHRFLCASNYQP
ncbi:hypothetical protein [Billgrantia kenyensis]|uniref:Reverse transcriptase domain-containing protein n=1 Tax=Billgrantia kenyensis TaxID=321266 RepID=A0A7V9W575_9GAMM|nr:hypothetical protein [Halomonas kenyensis]MBA2781278.1 hypothetical protein [Halomonas kenyensis]MCG6663941.1 hypothetical protein [Halomonas kenyensis]